MNRVLLSIMILASGVVFTGCALSRQALPQEAAQRADEIGPQTVVINQGVMVLVQPGGQAPAVPLAGVIAVDSRGATATADGSQQGSTDQAATQSGGSVGPVSQEPKADVNLDVKLPDALSPGG